jgi:two-component system, cell cycle sensor histidine kinase and response regulator CckA
VVYGIVGSHGGYIEVDSKMHRGTTFCVYLPASTRELIASWHPAGIADVPQRGAETILLIEDEEPLLHLMKLFLESNGYTVLTAEDGLAAIDLYAHYAADIALVLTDVGLPSLGGISVVQKLREINPSVRALLASGYLTEQQHAEAQSLGIEKIIPKPYQPNVVLSRIRETIDQ